MDFDLIGPWTEVKLDILREYAPAYSKILRANGFHHSYIDAFAAGGAHVSRTTKEIVPGSPLIALSTDPPFDEYHFIDKDEGRIEQLRGFSADVLTSTFTPETAMRSCRATFSLTSATKTEGAVFASLTLSTLVCRGM